MDVGTEFCSGADGDAAIGDPRLPECFRSKVGVCEVTGCWLWKAQISSTGYGVYRSKPSHRFAYTALVGEIPDGLQIDHLCRNRACCNPGHLEPVTCRENLLRGETLAAANAAKTHCPAGHPYAGDNLKIKRGGRCCRECERARSRRDDPAPRGKHWSDKTHCPRGHEYSEANTYVYDGRRFCRECGRAAKREHAARVRQDPATRERLNERQRQRRRRSSP